MKQIAAAAIGGGVFALSYLTLGLPLALCTVAALGGYGSGLFLFYTRGSSGIDIRVDGIDPDTVSQTLNEATAKVDLIEGLGKKLTKPEVKSQIDKLTTIARGILEDIRKDPKDIKRARQFLNYYLDAVTRILSRYTDLTERGIASPEARAALEKAESLLNMLGGAFDKQRASLAQDDVLDLDTEMSVLEKTLDMEGLK